MENRVIPVINELYEKINLVNETLKQHKGKIEKRQGEIQHIIAGLGSDIPKIEMNEKQSHVKKLAYNQIKTYYKSIHKWKEQTDKYVSNKKFVNMFEESLLLIVFGDVKAGKSALGNFISGYYFQGTEYESLAAYPEFYCYDSSASQEVSKVPVKKKESFFKEGVIETTAEIQYFTIKDGLTWVDTPGIHSLTEENEDLTNEYIKFADMILFLTPSNNPVKQDELQEIAKLFRQDKPVLITITKSDKNEDDWDDEKQDFVTKTIPKSPENRKQQEDYLAGQIDAIGNQNILSKNQYISISTKLAVESVKENDAEKFEQSNFPAFYKQIGNVVSEKAVELKMKRPQDELNFVISELLEGISERNILGISEMLKSTNNAIVEAEKYMGMVDQTKEKILQTVKSHMMVDMQSLFMSAKRSGNFQKEVLADELCNNLQKILQKTIEKELGEILSDYQYQGAGNLDVTVSGEYKKTKTVIEYPVQYMEKVQREPNGWIEKASAFLFDTKYYDVHTVSKTGRREIETGDNFNELFNENWGALEGKLSSIVDKQIENMKKDYFSEILIALKRIKKELQRTEEQLREVQSYGGNL